MVGHTRAAIMVFTWINARPGSSSRCRGTGHQKLKCNASAANNLGCDTPMNAFLDFADKQTPAAVKGRQRAGGKGRPAGAAKEVAEREERFPLWEAGGRGGGPTTHIRAAG